jgi:hypothetical protein
MMISPQTKKAIITPGLLAGKVAWYFLSGATAATIFDGQGVGTISNDD